MLRPMAGTCHSKNVHKVYFCLMLLTLTYCYKWKDLVVFFHCTVFTQPASARLCSPRSCTVFYYSRVPPLSLSGQSVACSLVVFHFRIVSAQLEPQRSWCFSKRYKQLLSPNEKPLKQNRVKQALVAKTY